MITIKHKNLNKGKKTRLHCPLPEKEITNQIYEVLEIEHYKFVKEKGGTIIDLGANIGLTSLYLKDCADMIYAIEPNPKNFAALKHNTKDIDNIKIFNLAIYNENKDIYLFQTDSESPAQTISQEVNVVGKVKVKAVTLEKFMDDNNIKHVDCLKIDVEGSEYAILPSESFRSISKRVDSIVGEGHFTSFGGFPEAIPDILKEYGYKTEFTQHDPPNFIRILYYLAPPRKKYTAQFNTVFIAQR